jgi:transcriptional regulator with XRE-family HTH domain
MTEKQSKIRVRFGKRVRKLRRDREWSQEQMADKIDTSRSYISSVELGQHTVTIDIAERYAKAFGMSLPQLFTSV